MSKRKLFPLVAVGAGLAAMYGVVACNSAECSRDSDCKGERICDNGSCVADDNGGNTTTTSSTTSPACPCSAGQFDCNGTTSLNSCDDGCHWTFNGCTTACTGAGYDKTSGCEYSSNLGHDACMCFDLGGIGDACATSDQCASGSCNGAGWCSSNSGNTCTTDSGCNGTAGNGSNNTNGYANHCVNTTSGGHQCFPGCTINSDCAQYAFGICKSAPSNRGAFVQCCTNG